MSYRSQLANTLTELRNTSSHVGVVSVLIGPLGAAATERRVAAIGRALFNAASTSGTFMVAIPPSDPEPMARDDASITCLAEALAKELQKARPQMFEAESDSAATEIAKLVSHLSYESVVKACDIPRLGPSFGRL